MKPVYLAFKGLNSFSERAEIDFTKLTQSGIFGIFGDTGSGKSTILDAINFALYGDVGRSKEKTDIINYKCDSVEVTFTFNVLSEGERKNYTIERSIKRKSGVHKAALYEEVGGENMQIADNASTVKQKIIDIIGVSADDFRKCIALPQGEFAEFVKSDPREKIKLIERLFNLSRYGDGLRDKLRSLSDETEKEYNEIIGELRPYEGVTDEKIRGISGQLDGLNKSYALAEAEKAAADTAHSKAKELYSERLRLDEAQIKLLKLDEQSDEMSKLKNSLKLLPDCKQIVDEDAFARGKQSTAENEKKHLAETEKKHALAEISAEQAKKKLDEFNYDVKLGELSQREANLLAVKDKFEQLAQYRQKLGQTQTEYEKLDKEKTEQEKTLKLYTEQLQKLQAELAEIPELKIEDVLSDDVKAAIARGAYMNEFNFVCELREKLKEYKAESRLYKFITGELELRIKYLEQLVRGTTSNKADFNERVKQFEENYELREKYAQRISKGEKLVAKCQNVLSITEEKIAQKIAESKERSDAFKQIFDQLSASYGTQPDYAKISLSIKEDRKKLDNANARLKSELDGINNSLASLAVERKNCINYIGLLEGEIGERREKINARLAACGFESVQQCKNLLDEFGNYDEAQKKLDEYTAELAANKKIAEKLIKIDGINRIDEAAVKRAEAEAKSLEAKLISINGEIKSNEKVLATMHDDFNKKQELLKRLDVVNEKRNLVGQLKVLLYNNAFMKFVADGHLGEISKVASKTLLELTDGRYFLIYKDGFYVGDNFNGGTERGVNTLSGGETFLVSLSLALALSGVICARSNKDIEFFFLDEGFGTLDETLIEVVMNALERLKNSHFTIGIISHVEELKHRIESKIIVNKATESRGSTLTLSC